MFLGLSERQRFALFVHLNTIETATHSDGRRLARAWRALLLDGIAPAVAAGKGNSNDFSAEVEPTPYEVDPSTRDSLIEYLNRPMAAPVRFLLVDVGDALIADRDAK